MKRIGTTTKKKDTLSVIRSAKAELSFGLRIIFTGKTGK